MSKVVEAWTAAVEYVAEVAGVQENVQRERGVPPERLSDMRAAMRILYKGDPDAFHVVVGQDYAAAAARAVANLLALRAEDEIERHMVEASHEPFPPIGEDDKTPVTP